MGRHSGIPGHSVRGRRIDFILGACKKSAIFGSEGIGGGIVRHDSPLSLYSSLKGLSDVGSILFRNRAPCQRDSQNAEKKSHTSHVSHNKKSDLSWQLSFRPRNY
jgi:hypothetical protein